MRAMKTVLKIAAAVVSLTLIVILGREVPALLPPFTRWVASLGAWGPLAFIAGYSIAPVIFAPAFLLTIAAGAIFGFVKGVIYVMIGATIGASFGFMMPISTAPNAMAYATKAVSIRQMATVGIVFDIVGLVAVVLALRILCPLFGLC